jgi:hypothetical protein
MNDAVENALLINQELVMPLLLWFDVSLNCRQENTIVNTVINEAAG